MLRTLRLLLLLAPTIALAAAIAWFLMRHDEPRQANGDPAAASGGRLVAIIVFDQLRGDYLDRWSGAFGQDGFERIKREGAWHSNAMLPFACTATAPGHASLVTGANPNVHGIIENEWYDRGRGRVVRSFSGDEPSALVPPLEMGGGGLSPERMLAPTLTEALKAGTGGRGRLFSISMKQRAAVMMGGREPAGVYCFSNGEFHTSTYYRDRLPGWTEQFNRSGAARRWSQAKWERLGDTKDYERLAGPDDQPGEYGMTTMPKVLPDADAGPAYFAALEASPFGNELLWEFAKTCIAAEKLGTNATSDVLCLSFSANDAIGHSYGPDSHEVLDVTLRSDKLLGEIIRHLDETIGRDRYSLLITSDHGIAPLPEVASRRHPDARRINFADIVAGLDEVLDERFGQQDGMPGRWVENAKDVKPWVYLNRRFIESTGIPMEIVERNAAQWLANRPDVAAAFTRSQLVAGNCLPEEKLVFDLVRNAFHPERSGDVYVVPLPYLQLTSRLGLGVDHGSLHDYDRQVFFMALGAGVPKIGNRTEPFDWLTITPIACKLLAIEPPARSVRQLPRGW